MNRLSSLGAYLLSLAVMTVLLWSSVLPADAKEDTAHLSFKKTGQPAKGTFVYVVKKGDHLLAILRRELGVNEHRYAMVRRYNPHVKNLNLIHPGQKLILPKVGYAAARSEGTAAKADDALTGTQKGATTAQVALPPTAAMQLLRDLLARMDATLTVSGQHIIPLPDLGQVTVDCAMFPMIEFADGAIVFMDFKQQMPENVRTLIRKHWKNYNIVRGESKGAPLDTLSRAINASATYTMKALNETLRIGAPLGVDIPTHWLVSRKGASGDRAYRQLIRILPETTLRTPAAVLDLLAKQGVMVSEIVDGSLLAVQQPAADPKAESLSRLRSGSDKEWVFDLLGRLGYAPQRDTDMRIFEASRDGFDLSIRADIWLRDGDRRIVYLFKPLPNQFVDILKAKGMELVLLSGETRREILIEKTAKALAMSFSSVPYAFPVLPKEDPSSPRLVFPTLRMAKGDSRPLYLIDFDMDKGCYTLLHAGLGFQVIRY